MSDFFRPLKPDSASKLGEIGEALDDAYWAGETSFRVVGFEDLQNYAMPEQCEDCGCTMEAGHCYCCRPVFGYGERWKGQRHGTT